MPPRHAASVSTDYELIRSPAPAILSLLFGFLALLANVFPMVAYDAKPAWAHRWVPFRSSHSEQNDSTRWRGNSVRDPDRSGESTTLSKGQRIRISKFWRFGSIVCGILGCLFGVFGFAFTPHLLLAWLGFGLSVFAVVWDFLVLFVISLPLIIMVDIIFLGGGIFPSLFLMVRVLLLGLLAAVGWSIERNESRGMSRRSGSDAWPTDGEQNPAANTSAAAVPLPKGLRSTDPFAPLNEVAIGQRKRSFGIAIAAICLGLIGLAVDFVPYAMFDEPLPWARRAGREMPAIMPFLENGEFNPKFISQLPSSEIDINIETKIKPDEKPPRSFHVGFGRWQFSYGTDGNGKANITAKATKPPAEIKTAPEKTKTAPEKTKEVWELSKYTREEKIALCKPVSAAFAVIGLCLAALASHAKQSKWLIGIATILSFLALIW